jgi:caa(3)-type oxidase subunit IV
MADKKEREQDDKGKAKPAAKAKAEAKHEEKDAHGDHGHDDHGHDGHAHAAGAHGDAHAHKPNIREYMVIFVVLAVLTVVEVAVTRPELHIPHGPMTLALVGLALTKAAIVALYYMHLNHETKVLKMTVALPMAAPTIYALVLISEAAWRLTR